MMRQLSILLVMVLCFTIFGAYVDNSTIQAATAAPTLKNIKITANEVNIRQDKNTTGKIISRAFKDEVFELLGEAKDAQGRVWYKVEADFGNVTGWLAGWFCKKTDEKVSRQIKSKPGELLESCPKKDLLVKLLLLNDYSVDSLAEVLGKDYTVKPDYAYKKYEYKNDVYFEVNPEDEVVTIGVGNRQFYVNSVSKRTCDIFLKNRGDEIIIFEDMNMIIVDAASKKVIREYSTEYMERYDVQTGNFMGDSKPELFISGQGTSRDTYLDKKGIYKVVNDDFVRVYSIDSFDSYKNGIKANISKNILNVDVKIGNYTENKKSAIPDRVFYNTKNTPDKNKLLSIDPDWTVVQENGKWYVQVRNTVNIIMLTYYWGPPGDDMGDNSTMYNDLARVDVYLDLSSGTPVMSKADSRVKYDNDSLLNIKPLVYEEGKLVNGPELGMSMEEAYMALGGKKNEFEYSDIMELNGVELNEFCSEIVTLYVTNPNYSTTRGLKVGDNIEKVESLYGKPDVGFSGDGYVEYKFVYEDLEGNAKVNYYRVLFIYYEDNKVAAYEFYQVILD